MFDRSSRNRTHAITIAAALLYWLFAGELGARRDDGVMAADMGASALVVTVVSLLSNLFGWRRGKVDSSTFTALTSLRATVTDMGRSFLAGVVDVAGKLAALTGTFMRFIQKVFGRLYDLISKVVLRIVRILDKVFGPIIDFLEKIRGHLKKFYDKVLKPIIDTIEMVRSFLRLLSFFGVDWSKKLDAQLAQLEQYILAPYEFLVAKLNEAMNWINRIVTLDGLLQRVMLFNSLLRDVALTNSLWWRSNHRPMQEATRQDYVRPVESLTAGARAGQLAQYVRTGGGELAGAIDENIADVFIIARRTSLRL